MNKSSYVQCFSLIFALTAVSAVSAVHPNKSAETRVQVQINYLQVNSGDPQAALKINYHAYKTWFEFDLKGRPQQNPKGPC